MATRVKVSGHQIGRLQKQESELASEILQDEASVKEKKDELKILQEAIESLKKLTAQ